MRPNRHERRTANAQSKKQIRITAIHEAGHAVARYLTAESMGYSREHAIAYIETHPVEVLTNGGAVMVSSTAITYGPMFSRPMNEHLAAFPQDDTAEVDVERCRAGGLDVFSWAEAKAVIAMFGPVAEAKFTVQDIGTVVRSPQCENDKKDAFRDCAWAGMSLQEATDCVNAAIDFARAQLSDPKVWRAVTGLADNLPVPGRLEGRHCGWDHRAGAAIVDWDPKLSMLSRRISPLPGSYHPDPVHGLVATQP